MNDVQNNIIAIIGTVIIIVSVILMLRGIYMGTFFPEGSSINCGNFPIICLIGLGVITILIQIGVLKVKK